jgi:hypothetical protein
VSEPMEVDELDPLGTGRTIQRSVYYVSDLHDAKTRYLEVLKPKGTSADLAWPRKSQTFCASPTRIAWRSSYHFWATANTCICCSASSLSLSTTSVALVSRAPSLVSVASSQAKTEARVSSKSLCSATRAASWLSRLDSRVAIPAGSRSSLRSSRASLSYSFYSSSSTAHSRSSTVRTRTTSSSAYLMVPLAWASVEAYSSLASAIIH